MLCLTPEVLEWARLQSQGSPQVQVQEAPERALAAESEWPHLVRWQVHELMVASNHHVEVLASSGSCGMGVGEPLGKIPTGTGTGGSGSLMGPAWIISSESWTPSSAGSTARRRAWSGGGPSLTTSIAPARAPEITFRKRRANPGSEAKSLPKISLGRAGLSCSEEHLQSRDLMPTKTVPLLARTTSPGPTQRSLRCSSWLARPRLKT